VKEPNLLTRRRFVQVSAASAAGVVGGCAGAPGGVKSGRSISAAEGQHTQIGVTQPVQSDSWYSRTPHPEAQWFAGARLGLFVHWGISSVHGGIDLSWGMIKDTPWDVGGLRVRPNDYWELARRFNPDRYDPRKWLAAAKALGCRYAVMTTRHHDGFAMWPSRYCDFGTRTYLNGRDLVRPYVDACRAEGLKVGLYFSPPDWRYARRHMSFRYQRAPGPPLGPDHQPTTLETPTPEYVSEQQRQVRGQVEELLTRYGRIDLMWFDGAIPDAREAIPVEWVRKLQPHIVINPRLWGVGDFVTPECSIPQERPSGWWEMCHIWHAHGWGYDRREEYRSTAWVLELLAKAATWGGNLLINVSPRPDGSLPDNIYAKMAEGAAWMKIHAPAVFEADPGPYPERCNLPVTVMPKQWYIFAPPAFTGPIVLKEVDAPASAVLMASDRSVTADYSDGKATLALPAHGRDRLMDVVVVRWA